MSATDAFVDLIMTPLRSAVNCFGHNTTVCRILRENGFDVSAVANALGRWLCCGYVDTLYIQPFNYDVGVAFFNDLKNALRDIPEVTALDDLSLVLRTSGKKLALLPPYVNPPTLPPRHLVLRFMNMTTLPRSFDRESLAGFVYCGNTEDGPLEKYRCQEEEGNLCVRAGISRELPCGKCFSNGIKGRLRTMWFPAATSEFIDEGVCCEPLGFSKDIYMWEQSSDESDSDTD